LELLVGYGLHSSIWTAFCKEIFDHATIVRNGKAATRKSTQVTREEICCSLHHIRRTSAFSEAPNISFHKPAGIPMDFSKRPIIFQSESLSFSLVLILRTFTINEENVMLF
jgi:hypothetical protein